MDHQETVSNIIVENNFGVISKNFELSIDVGIFKKLDLYYECFSIEVTTNDGNIKWPLQGYDKYRFTKSNDFIIVFNL